MQIPSELWEIVDPRNWNNLTRLQKLEAVNLAIIGIYMSEDWRGRDARKVAALDRVRDSLIVKNWKKPKWEG